MLAKIYSAAVYGVDAYEVEIEVNGAGGDPVIVIVGLPDAAVKESRDLTVNLYSCIAIFSSHITLFHRSSGGIGSITSRILYSSTPYRSRVLASEEVFNKVKYSNL